MRSFSIISLLIALAAGGILWQKSIENSRTNLVPQPVVYGSSADDQSGLSSNAENCDDYNQDSPNCISNTVDEEQAEMDEQRRKGHAVMMESYNKKLEKYNKQIGGQQ